MARDFTDMPIGRYESDGQCSGEVFREKYLVPALEMYGDDVVYVNLSGIYGMGASFMCEAFGGLVREHNYDPCYLMSRLKIIYEDSDDIDYERLIIEMIMENTLANLEEKEDDSIRGLNLSSLVVSDD